jgi:hypothetical protein
MMVEAKMMIEQYLYTNSVRQTEKEHQSIEWLCYRRGEELRDSER